jgi:hypothetical protein
MLVGHSQHLQQQDLMSTSLPNVLAKDIRTMCTEFGVGVYNIDKSASGENFIDGVGGQRRRMSGGNQQQQRQSANSSCDRFDESDGGSYKCSSITDVVGQLVGGSTMPDQATVYNTTFTTKRVC